MSAVLARLRELSSDAHVAAAGALHAEGEAIKVRSQDFAPVDRSNLEVAHNVATQAAGGSVKTTISVGGTVDGVNVDNYAAWTHEGDYNLGPKSQAKADASGQPVGPKYLERAFREREQAIPKNVANAVAKVIR